MAEKHTRRHGKPIAHIEPETEARLEEAYGPAMEPPVETVISKEQQAKQSQAGQDQA